MSPFFVHDTKSKKQQRKPPEEAQKPGFQAVPHHQPQSETYDTAPMQVIFPAHRNTPVDSLCYNNVNISKYVVILGESKDDSVLLYFKI